MEWKLRSTLYCVIFSIGLAFSGGSWLLPLSNAGLARAEDGPKVNIEPRPAGSGRRTGSASRSGDIRVDSNLVLIPVVVTDRSDRAVTGLGREQFRLLDDKAEQVISHFTTEDVPVSIGVVFDASGSMGKKLARARDAVTQFLKAANPGDEFSLVEVNDRAQLLVGFTDRPAEIQDRMLFIGSKGRTALLDAIILSLNEMKNAKHARKAILIISDGGDNNSRYSEREVKNRLAEANVQIYALGILEPFGRFGSLEELGGPALLSNLARQTGGFFDVGDPEELTSIAAKIANALHNQYVLGYVPNAAMRDGKYHKVQVKVDRPKGMPPLRVSFRNGYFAPAN
jgi:Ca-activated chloride channel family protein